MRKIFLVDTENVGLRALDGASLLNEEDIIILFVTNRTDEHSFSKDNVSLMNSKADIKRIKVLTGGKNSLDFQLVSYLGLLIGYNADREKCDYYIISNDHGFESCINLLTNCSEHNLYLVPKISEVVCDIYDDRQIDFRNLEDEIVVELKSYGYSNKTVEKAMIAIKTSSDIKEIESRFFFMFGWNKKILNICKPIIENYYNKTA
jgi:hypothetical protein